MRAYLGVDIGSVSTNIVAMSEDYEILSAIYIRTAGRPINALLEGLKMLERDVRGFEICGVGTTGSARFLAGVIVGADMIKNEITAHAIAAIHEVPDVRTVFEIGGQDSKIIIIRDGVVVDFAMNTVCAAGTGSFLDHQAQRLGIEIERFGEYALKSKNPVRIAGRCTVFAESDMIHKQQMGYAVEDIIAGLCEALVRNYLANVAKGKDLRPPYVFQGGVAANLGIRKAFEKELGSPVYVPKYFNVMGALGMAILVKRLVEEEAIKTSFRGFQVVEEKFNTRSFECDGCPNRCEVVVIYRGLEPLACWGDRCGRWQNKFGRGRLNGELLEVAQKY
ncbi:MAG: acyl-CoA dehydratase activase [Synergistetes bacterium]|nr:acyl-CoA dehydratase activase [Synergistota bacterium]